MSLFKTIGTGTVTATKDTNTNEIMVYVPNLFPQAEGRMVANVEKVERASVNAYGETVRSTTLKSNSVPAIWKRMGDSSRITAPDVKEGSTVAIFQVEGQNTYYWTLEGVNPETFRLETVMYGFNANPDLNENGDFDVDNFYTFTIDTRSGLVQFRTSDKNGEASKFDIQINTNAGTLTIGGKNHSMFNIDDVERSFTYSNLDDTVVKAVKKQVTIKAPESISLFAEESFKLMTKTLNIQAKEANIDVGLTRWKGRIEYTGDSAQLGDHDQTGNYTHKGNVDRTGNTTSTGLVKGLTDVQTATVSLITHIHVGVKGGSDTSGPPIG